MIKTILKYSLRLFILAVGVTSLYLANLFLMKPYSIDHYLGKELVLGLIDSPEAMTYMGVFDNFNWLTKHNSKLSIPNEDDLEKNIKETEKIIKTLYNYKELKEFPYHDYPLNQIGGIHLNTIQFLNDYHPIRSYSEASDFISRVKLIDEVYDGVLADLEKQANVKIFPPEFVYERVIKQLNEFINYSNEEHPLYSQFIKKVEDLNLNI